MAQIIWTEPALSDLNEIAEYIALDKLDAARRLVKQVFSSADRLEQFPESGRIPPELENSKYREIIVGPCRIFYRVDQGKVYILYVMRGERQLRKYLLDELAQATRQPINI
ncbi:toxin ParE1/3/4 [Methylobacter tundripaludum]|uniref:Toxin ParE1/3/4 n=1 Tax=Methylobacter tundripaludum TaxID=173365 RepID=A0A2S6H477_9GAMM|nr:type II toxin-antitoxin system RelE/ParE family toxin [Methylobacter tundripaludum]PPK72285.1 toxin ParE1/3/4 [Methylobacter tundripaludum]